MPKPNYGFEKRQRELEKKRKKAEKAMKKTAPPAQQPAPSVPTDESKPGAHE
jgi:hypothetical protein